MTPEIRAYLDGLAPSAVRDRGGEVARAHRWLLRMRRAPARGGGGVARPQGLLPLHEQRAAGGARVAPAADAHQLERAHGVGRAPALDLEARRAQQPGEQQDVGEEGFGHDGLARRGRYGAPAPRFSARARSACTRSPRTASMSS